MELEHVQERSHRPNGMNRTMSSPVTTMRTRLKTELLLLLKHVRLITDVFIPAGEVFGRQQLSDDGRLADAAASQHQHGVRRVRRRTSRAYPADDGAAGRWVVRATSCRCGAAWTLCRRVVDVTPSPRRIVVVAAAAHLERVAAVHDGPRPHREAADAPQSSSVRLHVRRRRRRRSGGVVVTTFHARRRRRRRRDVTLAPHHRTSLAYWVRRHRITSSFANTTQCLGLRSNGVYHSCRLI